MGLIGTILKKIHRQDDVEYEQAIIRIALGSSIVLFLLVGSPGGEWMAYAFTGFFLIASALVLHIHRNQGDFPVRKIVGQFSDMFALTAVLYFGGEETVVAYCIYLWVIVGNGCRFGLPYMMSATVIACIFYGYIILTVPYWQQQKYLSFALWITLLVVPMYLIGLLTRLEEATIRLSNLSLKDGLTGLFNRRALDEKLEDEFKGLSADNSAYGILLLDIDHFKLINDSHGHLAGDHVLQQIAVVLTKCSREGDFVSRYGGEEFTLLVPGLCREDFNLLAERIRSTIEVLSIDIGHKTIHVTVSVGVAYWNEYFEDYSSWLNAADIAMYKAKDKGRNRVEYYQT